MKLINLIICFITGLFATMPKPVKNNPLYKGFVNETVTSAYIGDVSDVLLTLTQVGNQAVEKGSFYVQPGVQKELFLPRFNCNADQLQDRQETPDSPSDSYVYDERSIEPQDCMFYDEFNPRTYEDVWREFQPQGALVDRVSNPQILSAMAEETMKSVGTQIGKLIWRGDTEAGAADPLRFFDGMIKILTADGAVNPPPQGNITQESVLSIMASTEQAVPDEVWEDPNNIIHMSTRDYRYYLAAARALDFKGIGIEDAGSGMYAGKTIRFYSGMENNHIIVAKSTAGRDSNFWAAVDVAGDEENIKIARLQANSELFFVKVLFKYAVNAGNPTEIVLYLPV